MIALYKNKFYRVTIRSDLKGYLVTNRYTQVVEDEHCKLPTAIGSAIAMEAALTKLMEKAVEESTEPK